VRARPEGSAVGAIKGGDQFLPGGNVPVRQIVDLLFLLFFGSRFFDVTRLLGGLFLGGRLVLFSPDAAMPSSGFLCFLRLFRGSPLGGRRGLRGCRSHGFLAACAATAPPSPSSLAALFRLGLSGLSRLTTPAPGLLPSGHLGLLFHRRGGPAAPT